MAKGGWLIADSRWHFEGFTSLNDGRREAKGQGHSGQSRLVAPAVLPHGIHVAHGRSMEDVQQSLAAFWQFLSQCFGDPI